MIYTVTLNPSLDYILPAEHFALGAVNRARGERILPGGKGVNVSRVLRELGVPSVALGFAAGFTGEEFLRLAGECGVRADFLYISGQTRINVKIRAEEETDINAGGPAASEEDLRALAQKLAAAPQGAVLVLAGSVPASLSPECYVRLLSFSGRSDFRIALDAAGRLCEQSLALAPWLVKPNRAELEELVGERLSSRSEVARAARRLQERGARNVLASLGEEGAFLLSESGEELFIAAPGGEGGTEARRRGGQCHGVPRRFGNGGGNSRIARRNAQKLTTNRFRKRRTLRNVRVRLFRKSCKTLRSAALPPRPVPGGGCRAQRAQPEGRAEVATGELAYDCGALLRRHAQSHVFLLQEIVEQQQKCPQRLRRPFFAERGFPLFADKIERCGRFGEEQERREPFAPVGAAQCNRQTAEQLEARNVSDLLRLEPPVQKLLRGGGFGLGVGTEQEQFLRAFREQRRQIFRSAAILHPVREEYVPPARLLRANGLAVRGQFRRAGTALGSAFPADEYRQDWLRRLGCRFFPFLSFPKSEFHARHYTILRHKIQAREGDKLREGRPCVCYFRAAMI